MKITQTKKNRFLIAAPIAIALTYTFVPQNITTALIYGCAIGFLVIKIEKLIKKDAA
jgi:hypothetical protein